MALMQDMFAILRFAHRIGIGIGLTLLSLLVPSSGGPRRTTYRLASDGDPVDFSTTAPAGEWGGWGTSEEDWGAFNGRCQMSVDAVASLGHAQQGIGSRLGTKIGLYCTVPSLDEQKIREIYQHEVWVFPLHKVGWVPDFQ